MTNRELYNKINLEKNGIKVLSVSSDYNGRYCYSITFCMEYDKSNDYHVIGFGANENTASKAVIESMYTKIGNIS